MKIDWKALVKMTLLDPKEAAGQVMILRRGLSNESLWSAVVLVAVVNTLIISVGMQIYPPTPEQAPLIPRFMTRPALLAIFAAGAIVITIFVLHRAGRALGGQGDLRDMLAVFSWLELVQAAVQVAVLVLAFVAMPLASLLNFLAFFWGMWILIAFVDRVHGFDNPLKAISVLALGLGLMVMGLILFILLIGATAEGLAGHV